jgi:FkbM family methyltransferase
MDERVRLVDVGARGGIDSRWRPFYDKLEVMAFEPDPKECASLNAKSFPYSIQFLPVALGAVDGEQATLRLCRQPGCSSLLQPNMELCGQFAYGAAMEVVGEHPIVLNRLDTVCKDFAADVMKVDTQGTELDVLRGAGSLLDALIAVEIEVEFVPQYQRQALFADVDAFMRQQGFMLRGMRRTCWRAQANQVHPFGGQIIHGDVLYLRPERMNCSKGHIILGAYRQFDLLARFGATSLIPRESAFVRVLSRLFQGVRNRDLRHFVDRLRPPHATDWHDPDFF